MSLHRISMVSPDEGWAVGNISGSPNSLLMHYEHGRWTILPKPAGLDKDSEFGTVSMISASEGWALASFPYRYPDVSTRTGSVFVHYSHGTWAATGDPSPYIAGPWWPSSLAMTSTSDGWATVEDHTLHYDGTAWREVTALTAHDLGGGNAVAATGPNDVWIGGWVCVGCTMSRPANGILHFDGHTWIDTLPPDALAATFPIGGPVTVTSLSMLPSSNGPANEGWAVANTSSGGIFLHYRSGRWTVQGGPVKDVLHAITMHSATDGWAVGSSGTIYRYDAGKQAWGLSARPEGHELFGVAAVSATEAWAVGLGRIYHLRKGGWETETNVVWSKQAEKEWT